MRYSEYVWSWVKAYELYEFENEFDLFIMAEGESKAVRYTLFFVLDCIREYEEFESGFSEVSKELAREMSAVLLKLARKYFVLVYDEIRNPILRERIAEKLGLKEEGEKE